MWPCPLRPRPRGEEILFPPAQLLSPSTIGATQRRSLRLPWAPLRRKRNFHPGQTPEVKGRNLPEHPRQTSVTFLPVLTVTVTLEGSAEASVLGQCAPQFKCMHTAIYCLHVCEAGDYLTTQTHVCTVCISVIAHSRLKHRWHFARIQGITRRHAGKHPDLTRLCSDFTEVVLPLASLTQTSAKALPI